MGRGRHGHDSGRLVPGLRCGHDLQGMAWTGAPRARTRRVRPGAEILAQPEVGPARTALELDHDHPSASGYVAGKLSALGSGPRRGDAAECGRPRAFARGIAGAVAAAAKQRHRFRHSLLLDQPARVGDGPEMGAPRAPGLEGFAPRSGRLQGTDALSGRGGGLAGVPRFWPIGIGHWDRNSRIGMAWARRGPIRKMWPKIT